jgi:hypothetical protein
MNGATKLLSSGQGPCTHRDHDSTHPSAHCHTWYSSSPKSPVALAFSVQGFQTTASGQPCRRTVTECPRAPSTTCMTGVPFTSMLSIACDNDIWHATHVLQGGRPHSGSQIGVADHRSPLGCTCHASLTSHQHGWQPASVCKPCPLVVCTTCPRRLTENEMSCSMASAAACTSLLARWAHQAGKRLQGITVLMLQLLSAPP